MRSRDARLGGRSFSNPGQPFDPSDPIGPKFAPATGQPRTEVHAGTVITTNPPTFHPRTEAPVGPDGSGTILQVVPQEEIRFQLADEGTVVELGEAFRVAMEEARPGELQDIRLRHLYRAVAELAKVVERIGGGK